MSAHQDPYSYTCQLNEYCQKEKIDFPDLTPTKESFFISRGNIGDATISGEPRTTIKDAKSSCSKEILIHLGIIPLDGPKCEEIITDPERVISKDFDPAISNENRHPNPAFAPHILVLGSALPMLELTRYSIRIPVRDATDRVVPTREWIISSTTDECSRTVSCMSLRNATSPSASMDSSTLSLAQTSDLTKSDTPRVPILLTETQPTPKIKKSLAKGFIFPNIRHPVSILQEYATSARIPIKWIEVPPETPHAWMVKDFIPSLPQGFRYKCRLGTDEFDAPTTAGSKKEAKRLTAERVVETLVQQGRLLRV